MRATIAPRILLGVLCALGLITAARRRGGPKVVPVAGMATVDGKPLEGFVVLFIPDEEKGNTAEIGCAGRVREDGRYSLTTDDRYGQYNGAPPGWYKV